MHADLKTSLKQLRSRQDRQAKIGFVETGLRSVRLFWAEADVARAPLSYAPGIAIIASGRKIGFFDDHRIEYGPGQYLAVGLPLFFECETMASADEPLIGVFIELDADQLSALAGELTGRASLGTSPKAGLGIEPLTMPEQMLEAVTRLARQLLDPVEAALLGQGTLREIFFHALRDHHGRVLLNQVQGNSPEARIARVLRDLDHGPDRSAGIADLANAIGMSSATFHRHFKAVTGSSPLQYLKRKRLMQAKSLLIHNKMGVAETAHAVGYASAAQFSRDFSAYFGVPPSSALLSPYPA